ncbi:MAG: glycosyltransferase [Clostridia bacterium]|nr:glycosyltransferase [Clostridia bacterium]
MACGTPVIANHTSNLDRYILDGKTGVVCKDETPQACLDALRRAIALTPEERKQMRSAAFEMAQSAFSFKEYVNDTADFLKKVK